MSYLLKELNKIKQFRTILQYPHLGGWGRRIILNLRPDVLYRQYLAKQDKYRLKLLGDRGSWLLSWFWKEVFPINDHSTICSFQKEGLLSVKVIFYSMLTGIDELLLNNCKWFAIIWLLCEFSNMVHIPLIFKYLPNYSLWDTIFTFTTLQYEDICALSEQDSVLYQENFKTIQQLFCDVSVLSVFPFSILQQTMGAMNFLTCKFFRF